MTCECDSGEVKVYGCWSLTNQQEEFYCTETDTTYVSCWDLAAQVEYAKYSTESYQVTWDMDEQKLFICVPEGCCCDTSKTAVITITIPVTICTWSPDCSACAALEEVGRSYTCTYESGLGYWRLLSSEVLAEVHCAGAGNLITYVKIHMVESNVDCFQWDSETAGDYGSCGSSEETYLYNDQTIENQTDCANAGMCGFEGAVKVNCGV